jgi:hypothetical protein
MGPLGFGEMFGVLLIMVLKGIASIAVVYVGARLAIRHERRIAS